MRRTRVAEGGPGPQIEGTVTPMAVVSADLVRQWSAAAMEALGSARAEIDALNVYPVPDGDTGTNMALTVESVGLKPLVTCNGSQGLRSSFSAKVTLL